VPDYIALVKFLMEPLLDQPEALKVHCETNPKGDRLWIRVAFDSTEKGRVFGRNGRTIQAMRTVINTAALNSGQTVQFEVFDPNPSDKESREHKEPRAVSEPRDNRPTPPIKPKPKVKQITEIESPE